MGTSRFHVPVCIMDEVSFHYRIIVKFHRKYKPWGHRHESKLIVVERDLIPDKRFASEETGSYRVEKAIMAQLLTSSLLADLAFKNTRSELMWLCTRWEIMHFPFGTPTVPFLSFVQHMSSLEVVHSEKWPSERAGQIPHGKFNYALIGYFALCVNLNPVMAVWPSRQKDFFGLPRSLRSTIGRRRAKAGHGTWPKPHFDAFYGLKNPGEIVLH